MKRILIVFVLLACLVGACDSIDKRFEETDELRLILMEAVDEPYANPNDVYTYKLMAQSSSGLQRVVISNVSHELDSLPDLPTIVLADSVNVDSNGYLSRHVKTAIIEYPIIVPPFPGESVSLDFMVEASNGRQQTIHATMLIANYKEGKTWFFKNTYSSRNYAFYSTQKDACYGWLVSAGTYYKKNVDVIDFYAYASKEEGYCIYSPSEPEVQELVTKQKDNNYDYTEMRKTLLVKLDGVNYKKAKDKEILAIDFSNAVGKLPVKKGDCVGFKLADGRKGIMYIKAVDASYLDFQCKTQTIPQ